jgi:hypothetical protein
MHQATIKRLTQEELETNTQILTEFVALFTVKNHSELMKLFHPKGRYFNIPARATLDGYFYEVLKTRYGVSQHFCMGVNHGYTADHMPGHHVVEFRFMDFDFDSHPEADPTKNLAKALGEPGDDDLKELIYRYALTFKDGKIFTLRHPKRFIADLEYFNLSN